MSNRRTATSSRRGWRFTVSPCYFSQINPFTRTRHGTEVSKQQSTQQSLVPSSTLHSPPIKPFSFARLLVPRHVGCPTHMYVSVALILKHGYAIRVTQNSALIIVAVNIPAQKYLLFNINPNCLNYIRIMS